MTRRVLFLVFVIGFLLPTLGQAETTTVEACHCSYYPAGKSTAARLAFIPEAGSTPLTERCQAQCMEKVQSAGGTFISSEARSEAVEETPPAAEPSPIIPRLSVPIPNLSFTKPVFEDGSVSVNFIGQYIIGIYRWLIGVAAVFAVVMIMVGGIQYMLGATGKGAKEGMERIKNAIVGFVILLASYLLLYTVNPQLVVSRPISFSTIKRVDNTSTPAIIARPELAKNEKEFRSLACPSSEELRQGVSFFTTGYYKPAYGEKQGYASFECNIGMQCSCPNNDDRQSTASCSAAGGTWRPCTPFPEGTEYCNATSPPPVVPQAFHTAAVSSCLPKGTVFKIFGSGLSAANNAVWYAEDGGAWITGRRIDLFTGEGNAAYTQAVSAGGTVTLKTCPGNDPSQCPVE